MEKARDFGIRELSFQISFIICSHGVFGENLHVSELSFLVCDMGIIKWRYGGFESKRKDVKGMLGIWQVLN